MKSVRFVPPAVFALLFGQTATADVVRHATIPASLWGTWALNLDDCNNADNVIVLSAKGRDSSEVKCTVDWVSQTPGARGSIFSAHLHCRRTANGSDKTIDQRYPHANGRQPDFGRPRFQQPQKLPALPCNYSCNLPIGSGDLIYQTMDLRGRQAGPWCDFPHSAENPPRKANVTRREPLVRAIRRRRAGCTLPVSRRARRRGAVGGSGR